MTALLFTELETKKTSVVGTKKEPVKDNNKNHWERTNSFVGIRNRNDCGVVTKSHNFTTEVLAKQEWAAAAASGDPTDGPLETVSLCGPRRATVQTGDQRAAALKPTASPWADGSFHLWRSDRMCLIRLIRLPRRDSPSDSGSLTDSFMRCCIPTSSRRDCAALHGLWHPHKDFFFFYIYFSSILCLK